MLARLGFCICPLISIVGTAPVYATDIPALVQRARPAVVEILTFDQQNNLLKTGTGFFISQDGLLLTNFHVISGASSIMAKTPTGAVYFLKSVLSASKTYDVAELQFFATDVPYLSLGSSSGAVERQRVVNVAANDTLKLRSGPGTSFRVLAEIPADETNITAFNYDQIWDGDTWWCPVEWRGLRGYVGRSHLPKP